MSKAEELFEKITNTLIEDIEAGANGSKWEMPWNKLALGMPRSIDGRAYRGMNSLWLAMLASRTPNHSSRWGTYKAWQRHGSQVRKGEKSTAVLLWLPIEVNDEKSPTGKKKVLMARTYNVFAAEQADGTAAEKCIADASAVRDDIDSPARIVEAESYFAAIGARIIEGGDRAYYSPAADEVHVPSIGQFRTVPHYYGTLAHEMTHWTGHGSRCARDMANRFGSDAYAAEELVAELGAAMWCARAGLSATTREDHAQYLGSWLRVLKADARSLLTVASKSQAAIDYMDRAAGIASAESEADAA